MDTVHDIIVGNGVAMARCPTCRFLHPLREFVAHATNCYEFLMGGNLALMEVREVKRGILPDGGE